MFCRDHPQRIALDRCTRCGGPVCGDCLVSLQARTYCRKCAAVVGQAGEAPAQRRSLVSVLRKAPAYLLAAVLLAALPFLIRNAVRHYRELAHIRPARTTPAGMLRSLAGALEAYARDHDGVYPDNSSALYFADPPYLDEIYCGTERNGYRINCTLSGEGYVVTARPAGQGEASGQEYSIATGAVLSPAP